MSVSTRWQEKDWVNSIVFNTQIRSVTKGSLSFHIQMHTRRELRMRLFVTGFNTPRSRAVHTLERNQKQSQLQKQQKQRERCSFLSSVCTSWQYVYLVLRQTGLENIFIHFSRSLQVLRQKTLEALFND